MTQTLTIILLILTTNIFGQNGVIEKYVKENGNSYRQLILKKIQHISTLIIQKHSRTPQLAAPKKVWTQFF